MEFSLSIHSTTDHLTLGLVNATYILDGVTWNVSRGNLYCNFSETLFSIGQTAYTFNPLQAVVRVSVPAGTEFLVINVDRGGIGAVTLTAQSGASGTSTPNVTGQYALSLTFAAALRQLEKEGRPPGPKDEAAQQVTGGALR